MNRHAWTSHGPVTIIRGRSMSTASIKKLLSSNGIEVTSWARNWMAFVGYDVLEVSL